MNNFLIGGTEKFLYNLIKNFNKDEFQIEIITVWGSGPLEKDFQSMGLPIYFARSRKNFSNVFLKIFSVFGATLRLIVFLKKNKPDAVITSLYQSDILGIFSTWLVGVKTRIFIQHDVKRLNIFIKIVKKIFAINLATKIIANSNTTKDFLISFFGVPEKKISVIHNGINVLEISGGIKELERGNIVFGIVGRLEPVKGHIYFLQAMKILRQELNLEPQVLIIGDGGLRLELEKFVADNNLNNIQFLGMIDNIPDKLKLIDVLVVPSLSEGFGLVALEGLFSEKIVVASDLPSIKEFIENNNNGILFEPCNSEELAIILKRLATDFGFCQNMRIKIKRWLKVGQKFDITNVTLRYEEAIRILF
jgi:glycosyltransferase involved in cell wall biosynthesis